MSHDLTIRADNYVEMAFVGDTPWHGLGQKLDPNADMATWRKAAGMDWSLESTPVQFFAADADGGVHNHIYTGQNVLYRSDNHEPMSVVSDRYKPVQPAKVLEFFSDLVEQAGFRLHTAGTLRGGRRLWALAETGKYAEVCKDDGVGGFLLLSTSCDKSLSTTARFTSVRVVCNNTLTLAHEDKRSVVKVPHSATFDADKVKLQLGCVAESFGSFLAMAKALHAQKLNATKASQFVQDLVRPYAQIKKGAEVDLTQNRAYQSIMALFEGGAKGSALVGHSKWAMLNAVTEYYDHHNPSRSADYKLDNAWFGVGELVKARAVELLSA